MKKLLILLICWPTLLWAACPNGTGANPYSTVVCADSPSAYFNMAQTPSDGAGMTDIAASNNCNDSSFTNPGGTHLTSVLGIPGVGINSKGVQGDGNAGAFATSVATTNANCEGAFTSASGVTVELWVKPTSSAATAIPLSFAANGNNWQYAIYYSNGADTKFASNRWECTAAHSTFLEGGTTHAAGSWYQVVGIFNGTTSMDIWVNGVQENTTSTFTGYTPCTGSSSLGILYQRSDFVAPFFGVIDEVAAFRGSLSGTRILAHYNAGIAQVGTVYPYTVKNEHTPWIKPVAFEPAIPFWMFAKSRSNKIMPFQTSQYEPESTR